MYKNTEGYPDPTPGKAMGNITRQKKYRPKIYICSPFAGNTQANILNARRYCAFAVDKGYIPYAGHLFFPQFLFDSDPKQRELGLFMAMVFLDSCKECWVFGDTISKGMEAEIKRAKKRGIVLRCFTEQCEEVEEWVSHRN